MALVSDNYHQKKLNENNINIKTKYIVDSNVLERNTDNSKNDDVNKGMIIKKEYYRNKILIYTQKFFDSRIEYTFISKELENKPFTCENCGMKSKIKNFIDGCPYCGTSYNIDYTDKDLGSKYHYDLVLRSNKYKIVTAIVDLIISMIFSFIFIKFTSRTFNSYDISKIFIYGFILSVILYYFFYLMDAYIILGPIKKYKEKENEKQMNFWETTKIDKKTFFNNLNYELKKKYYSMKNIIDYDILDYTNLDYYKNNDNEYISIKANLRIVFLKNNKIKSKYITDTYILKYIKDDIIILKDGANLIRCHNCGASIDVNNNSCKYCGSKLKYFQKWIIE